MNAISCEKRSAGKILNIRYKGEQLWTEKKQEIITGLSRRNYLHFIYVNLIL